CTAVAAAGYGWITSYRTTPIAWATSSAVLPSRLATIAISSALSFMRFCGLGTALTDNAPTPSPATFKRRFGPLLLCRQPKFQQNGAGGRIRTGDLFLTTEVLFLLSYTSIGAGGRTRTRN